MNIPTQQSAFGLCICMSENIQSVPFRHVNSHAVYTYTVAFSIFFFFFFASVCVPACLPNKSHFFFHWKSIFSLIFKLFLLLPSSFCCVFPIHSHKHSAKTRQKHGTESREATMRIWKFFSSFSEWKQRQQSFMLRERTLSFFYIVLV